MRTILRLFAYFMIWIALTSSLAPFSLISGALVSIATLLIVNRFFNQPDTKDPDLLSAIIFIPYGLYLIIKSSLEIIKMILFNETTVRYKKVVLNTKSMLKQNVIANTITLTPGTMTVSKENKRVGVYYLTASTQDIDVTDDIKKMEKRLGE